MAWSFYKNSSSLSYCILTLFTFKQPKGKTMKQSLRVIFLSFISILLLACSPQPKDNAIESQQQKYIIAINNPLAYFTEQLVGDLAEVRLTVPADIDPAQWQPTLEDIIELQHAKLVVLNGAGYSTWLDKVSLSSSVLLDTTADQQAQFIDLPKQSTHSHGPEGEHSHSGYAFTTWMDMTIAQQQVAAISDKLITLYPQASTDINQRKALLIQAISELDASYKEQAQLLENKAFFYSHPVYQYFERRYKLAGESFHWEPEQMPSASQWDVLSNKITDKSNTLFIWEDQPSEEIASKFVELGITTVVIKPAANRTEKNWFAEQQENILQLKNCCIATNK